jgi:hypothetical protein
MTREFSYSEKTFTEIPFFSNARRNDVLGDYKSCVLKKFWEELIAYFP